ncbi:hypothetical protein ASPCAL08345 [Aspergillus calidoustus]|uniref:Uncharacterized protein n=1 Tax=Aspergillus calidoustus TaxID=454130 RepID=A0A0U5CQD7_ASPCI|nr:hypothetical protein ASPCAL08345 [Aspergillus calidoustus]
MAPTPKPRQKWFLSKSPSEKLAEPTPPSNNNNGKGKSATKTKSPTSKPAPSTPAPPLLRDLYTSLETSYNPLLTIICNHAFIKEARYPVRQSARIRFVRDVYYEAGLLGYSDEAVKRVLVDVKRFFLERVGRADVFDEEGGGFGEEVDDLAGYHVVVVGDRVEDGDVETDTGDGVQDGDEEGWETESESKASGVDDAVDEFERAVGSVKSASQLLRDIAALLGGSPSHRFSESPSDNDQRQAESAKSEKKRKRKHKQSHGEESVEALPRESDKPLGELEEECVDPIESQVKSGKLSKSEKKRRRKRSRGEESVEASRETDEPLGDHEEACINPVESQTKPVQHENKRKPFDEESVEVAVGTDLPLDDPKAKPTDLVETNAETNKPQIDDKSHASLRRVRKHKKNRKDKMKARKSSSKDASTKLNTPKKDRDDTLLDF